MAHRGLNNNSQKRAGRPSPALLPLERAAVGSAGFFPIRQRSRFFSSLFSKLRIRRLRALRQAAFQAHREALRRGDTRDQFWTRKALYKATTDVMRAEGRW